MNKCELLKADPSARAMAYFNKYTRGEQFTKAEFEKKDPDAWEMARFNKCTRGDDKFTEEEIAAARGQIR